MKAICRVSSNEYIKNFIEFCENTPHIKESVKDKLVQKGQETVVVRCKREYDEDKKVITVKTIDDKRCKISFSAQLNL